MRLLLLLILLLGATAGEAAVRFDGTPHSIPRDEWLTLDRETPPPWGDLAKGIERYQWVPLEQYSHRSGLHRHLMRLELEVRYAGKQWPLLIIPYAFIPEITVGLVHDGKLLMWRQLAEEMGLNQRRIHRTFGMLPLPIETPGTYQLLIESSNVANSVIVHGAALHLEDDFLLRDYPLDVSVAAAFIGGVCVFILFCVALLIYRFQQTFFYALIFLVGALGTLLIREGVLFLSLSLDVSWWAMHILPLSMGMVYSGVLLYIHSDFKGTRWRWTRQLVGACAWITLSVGLLNIPFPTREHLVLGLSGMAATVVGLVTALVLVMWRALRGGLREWLFALCFGSFVLVVLARMSMAITEQHFSIPADPWYFTIMLISVFIFVEYALSLSWQHAEVERRKTAHTTRFDLVSRFSHELRTPLNAVIGLADLLKDARELRRVKKFAEMIHDAGYTLLALVNDILDFSKLEASETRMDHQAFRLDKVQTMVVAGFLPQLLQERFHLKVLMEPSTPCFLIGDELRLKQIFNNLLSNAIKFSDMGGLVELRTRAQERRDGQIKLLGSVSDRGRGIPADQLAAVFEPFSQVEREDDSGKGGTGLGLAICRLLVEQMGGEIWVESEVGRGSVFHFYIWLDLDPNAPDLSRYFAPLRGKRILFLSAREAIIEVFSAHLAYWGARVIRAEHAQSDTPTDIDLVVLDNHNELAPEDADWVNGLPAQIAIHVLDLRQTGWTGRIQHPNAEVLTYPSPMLDMLATFAGHLSGVPVSIIDKNQTAEVVRKHNHRVLLVDDNAVNLTVASKLLRSLNVDCDTARDGQEALDRLYIDPTYTLVLLDCEMPGLDGFDVCRRWRAHESEQALPRLSVVALTAHALDEIRDECLAAGMDDVVFKPIGRAALVNLLNSYGLRGAG